MNAHMTGLVTAVCLAVPAAGQSMDWCTYLGGSDDDTPAVSGGVLVDALGQTYVVGRTYSSDFPTTQDACNRQLDGDRDAFVSRLPGDGATLAWSTFLGGSDLDSAWAVTIDGQDRLIVAGGTRSPDFPVTDGAYDTTHNGEADAFVAILDPDQCEVVNATFLGGSGADAAFRALYDASGEGAIVVVGVTRSEGFPVTDDAYDTSYNGVRDVFVARFDPTLSTLAAATFLGGNGDDFARNAHVGAAGLVTIGVSTESSDMPTSEGAFDDTFDAGPDEGDGYVAQLDQLLTELVYGTYLGGSADESPNAMDVEASGSIVLAGFTSSADFPVTDGAYDTTYNGGDVDVYVTRLDPAASGDAQLVASTFVGGPDYDGANGVVVDRVSGAVTITGSTTSSEYPVTDDAAQATYGGSGDGVLSRLDRSLGHLTYSTYCGGTGTDWGYAVSGAVASRITVAGRTESDDFRVTDGAYDDSWNGNVDVFALRVDLCPEDLDENGFVDFGDILTVLTAWGNEGGPEDLDGSGFVDFGDLLIVLAAWDACE